jgi:spore coat polysaccharide biosynthesis predicted glycosyltransferase SpsG
MDEGARRTVLCWVDAGPAVGLGHLSRGLAIAEALADRDVACLFALPRVLALQADAVVVDVPQPLARAEVRALGGGRRVLVVDNAGEGRADADLVLAPFGRGRGRRWLVGPEFVPLRRALRLAGELRGPRPASHEVLVSMGATDPGGLTVPALEGLELAKARFPDVRARVVANPAADVWRRLPPLLRRLGSPPPSSVAPDAMVTHLAEAAVAVVAMGVTVYEALACGVPAVVLSRTRADVAHARSLAERGAVVSLGVDWTAERIGSAVAALLAAPARLAAMSEAGRRLVDGRGAERVATRLLATLDAPAAAAPARRRPAGWSHA